MSASLSFEAVLWVMRTRYGNQARAKSVGRPPRKREFKVGYYDAEKKRNVWTGHGRSWEAAMATDAAVREAKRCPQ